MALAVGLPVEMPVMTALPTVLMRMVPASMVMRAALTPSSSMNSDPALTSRPSVVACTCALGVMRSSPPAVSWIAPAPSTRPSIFMSVAEDSAMASPELTAPMLKLSPAGPFR